MLCVLFYRESLHAQLRVVDLQHGGTPPPVPPPGMPTVLQAIGSGNPVDGIALPIDVLVLQEQRGNGTTTQGIVNTLNGLYGAGTYAMAAPTSQLRQHGYSALIIPAKTVQFIGQTTASTVASDGAARPTGRYELPPGRLRQLGELLCLLQPL